LPLENLQLNLQGLAHIITTVLGDGLSFVIKEFPEKVWVGDIPESITATNSVWRGATVDLSLYAEGKSTGIDLV